MSLTPKKKDEVKEIDREMLERMDPFRRMFMEEVLIPEGKYRIREKGQKTRIDTQGREGCVQW